MLLLGAGAGWSRGVSRVPLAAGVCRSPSPQERGLLRRHLPVFTRQRARRPPGTPGSAQERPLRPARETEPLTMVATGSLSSKNPASISELLDCGYHPESLLSDFDYWDYVVPEPNLNEVIFEESTCQNLVKMLENCLSKSKQTKLGCSKVLVPEKLTQRIAQDVLRLSSTEPCGLRGCVMHVNLEIENVCKKLDRIVCDSSVVPTFELTLVFKQENCSWTSFRDFFFSRGRFSSGFRRTLILSSGFRLVKKKLYSLIGTTVIEGS
ncbi:DNA damage-inducible transcript 4-like protein [Macaca thibetana thibetana]|nr:DNA damage-inducible transcript 4-like protein [Macaca thibetana thibetana]